MSIVTSRATDYGLADVSCILDNVGVIMGETSDAFMGPVTLHTLTVLFTKSAGGDYACYLRVYDALNALRTDGTAVLADPLWILQCRSGQTFTMSFPDGYTFTKGISLRATTTGGTGALGDPEPSGVTRVTLLGRKS
jgi:hypothetical protein